MNTNSKPKLLAIINPISGGHSKKDLPKKLSSKIDADKYALDICFTTHAGHATELALKAIEEDYFGVIAVGGDGTVNEVAAAIRDSNVALSIVPCGSGNGLARHLNIPLNTDKAINLINQGHVESFDYCTVNERPFFCTCGVGFDAHISSKFAESKARGPFTYFKKTIAEYLKYRSETYEIETPKGKMIEKAFLIACGNASQYGNNAFIAPHADMQDGLIEITVIHPFNPLDTPILGILLFTRHIDQDINILSFSTPEVTINRPLPGIMHLDGEPVIMDAKLNIKCIKNGIKIFVSQSEPYKRVNRSPLEEGFWEFVNNVRNELKL